MSETVSLSVVKSERAEQDRTFSKEELRKWVEELPDDITGFVVCATKHQPDGGIWTRTHNIGNTVLGRYEALHIAIVEFMQFKGKSDAQP